MQRSILLAAVLALLAARAHAEVPSVCAAPVNLAEIDQPLPRTDAKLATKQPLTVVAIGSSSTWGVGASSPANSYPSRLAVELGARFPQSVIKVLNRGVNGEIEQQMAARFDRDVVPEHPDLVIWQVGTNSVIHGQDLTHYRPALEGDIARLKSTGADVLIMDMQYAPKVLAHPDYQDMLRKIDIAAHDEDVAVFHRFATMRYWITSGRLSFTALLAPDQLHMNDLSYRCVASLLAEAIERSAHSALARAPSVPTLLKTHLPPPGGNPSVAALPPPKASPAIFESPAAAPRSDASN